MLARILFPIFINGSNFDEVEFSSGKLTLITHSNNETSNNDESTIKLENNESNIKNVKSNVLAVFNLSDPTMIEELDLSDKNLKTIPSNLGKIFPNLRSLDLSCNQISSFDGLDSFKSLEMLDLSFNNLNGKDFDMKFNSSLKELYLNDNPLKNISNNSFKGLKSLEILDLSDTKIDHLPDSLGDLKNLKALNLDSNRIEVFPVSVLGGLKNLEHLFLSRNRLTVIPPEISDISQLKILELDENNLRYLPASIERLKLTYLSLVSNSNFNKSTLINTELGEDRLRQIFDGVVRFSVKDQVTNKIISDSEVIDDSKIMNDSDDAIEIYRV